MYNTGEGEFNCTDAEYYFNTAKYSGGAIYNFGPSLTLDDVVFANNMAGQIEEVVEYQVSWWSPETNGGAVYCHGSWDITRAEFEHNYAGGDGGALYLKADIPRYSLTEEEDDQFFLGTVTDSFFHGNQAIQEGGAVNALGNKFVNCVLSGNAASFGGGLLLNQWGRMVNSTLVANSAEICGGGIYTNLYGGCDRIVQVEEEPAPEINPTLANVILWDNTAGEAGPQVFNGEGLPEITHCLIQGAFHDGSWNTWLGIDAGENIAADPKFTRAPVIQSAPEDWPNNDYGDLRLRSNSPAKDKGDNQWIAGFTKDIIGKTRIVKGKVDIGAYEYQTPPPSPPPPPPVAPTPKAERLGGEDRFETAVEVSQAGWSNANTILLARSDDYADALAGVSLAHREDAPILLTMTSSLPQVTKAEIQRLGAEKVIILGGKGAVSLAVEQSLKSMGLTVERIAGLNRFDTAAAIAAKVAPNGTGEVALANGYAFADALSVAAYAARQGMPILLTTTDKLPAETEAAIKGLEADSVLVVGGTKVISSKSLAVIEDYQRIAGADRYATAIALANHFNPSTDRIFVATGLKFPDSLTGAVLAAKEDCGLILVNGGVPTVVANYLDGKNVLTFTVLGGTAVISEGLVNQLIN